MQQSVLRLLKVVKNPDNRSVFCSGLYTQENVLLVHVVEIHWSEPVHVGEISQHVEI